MLRLVQRQTIRIIVSLNSAYCCSHDTIKNLTLAKCDQNVAVFVSILGVGGREDSQFTFHSARQFHNCQSWWIHSSHFVVHVNPGQLSQLPILRRGVHNWNLRNSPRILCAFRSVRPHCLRAKHGVAASYCLSIESVCTVLLQLCFLKIVSNSRFTNVEMSRILQRHYHKMNIITIQRNLGDFLQKEKGIIDYLLMVLLQLPNSDTIK